MSSPTPGISTRTPSPSNKAILPVFTHQLDHTPPNGYKNSINWHVAFTAKAKKQAGSIPSDIQRLVFFLVRDLLMENGPIRPHRPHYGKLKGTAGAAELHHYHLKQGRPTYVAVWRMADAEEKRIEVIYVGTHEKAHYGRMR